MDPLACRFEKNDTNQLGLVVTKLQWRNKQFYINLKFKKKKKNNCPQCRASLNPSHFPPFCLLGSSCPNNGSMSSGSVEDKGLISEYAAVTLISCFVSLPTGWDRNSLPVPKAAPRLLSGLCH